MEKNTAVKLRRDLIQLTLSIGFTYNEKWMREVELDLHTLLTRVKVPSKL